MDSNERSQFENWIDDMAALPIEPKEFPPVKTIQSKLP
jgi:hypothetical protein